MSPFFTIVAAIFANAVRPFALSIALVPTNGLLVRRTVAGATGAFVVVKPYVVALLVPLAFVSVTDARYCVPALRPLIVHVVVVTEQRAPPGLKATLYPVIVDPLAAPLAHFSTTLVSVTVEDIALGAPGPLPTTTLAVPEAILVPVAFVAVTLKLYVVPLVSPVITHVSCVVTQLPLGLPVTW